ncbi:MAG: hypothetical protein RL497_67 [Pseudomonadota bacterium]|jgi:hypothetical protein
MPRHLFGLLFALIAPLSWAVEPLPHLLKDWQGWVLEGSAPQFCPVASDDARKECVWPSELTLAATEQGAEFKLAVDVFAPAWVDVPGGPGFWPQDVKSAGQWVPVREADERPQVYLPIGRHLLTGRFSWASLPRTLKVPEALGIVHLSLNGKTVELPSLESAGQLWLAAQDSAEEAESDSLSLKVFRLLEDSIPMLLTSRLELEVSGAEREVLLGPWLLPGFTPRVFTSELPAKLEPDGQLRVQVKPGTWSISLMAHSLNPKPNLSLPEAREGWPAQEIWSFQAAPKLRSVQITGGASIDPSQTTLPQEWRALPAYLLNKGQALVVEELFRGNPNPPQDELRLLRNLWLDFSGEGLTFSDQINGTLNQSARLDLAKPFELLKADVNHAAQVVTQVQPSSAGVELRAQALNLEAQGRIAKAAQMPVSAWGADMSAVNWTLSLPPGWSLFYASGADGDSGVWLSRWGLFDIFLVLIIVIALGKIVRPWVGVLALVCLLITYQRSGAAVAIWLNLAAVLALLPWVSGGFARWLKRYAVLSFASLMMVLISFSVAQVRFGLYPQLEASRSSSGLNLFEQLFVRAKYEEAPVLASKEDAPKVRAAAPVASRAEEVFLSDERASYQRMTSAAKKQYNLPPASQQIDPTQQTQTGPGTPKWSHNSVTLAWSGPVTPEQTTQLYWVPPWLNRPGYFLAAFLPWALAFALWQACGLMRINLPIKPFGRALGAALLVLGTGLSLQTPDAQAKETSAEEATPEQTSTKEPRGAEPSPALLAELKTRLLKAPLCLPDCVAIESATLHAKDDNLRLELIIHALAPSIYTLPASQTSWWPNAVLINGERASVRQSDDGELEVALLPGRQSLLLLGNLSGRNSLALGFGLNLNNLKTEVAGWSLSGEPTAATPSATLQLTRTQGASQHASKRLTPAPMAAFVLVSRRVQLGLEWGVETEITRLAPASGPIHLELPLIPGEAPLSSQPNTKGLMSVSLGADENSFTWVSRLKITPELNLTAPQQPGWIEAWQLEAAAQWHVEAQGLPALGNNLAPQWQPWPGEQLHLTIGKPPAVKGDNLTLQAVTLTQQVGQKAQDFSLKLSVLSNQGQDFNLKLPPDAKLTQVQRDENTLPPIVQDGLVKLPIKPGNQTLLVQWQQQQALPIRLSTPALDLGQPARNLNLSIQLPQDRWILLLGGPQMGPALLFWGVLLVVLGIAWALGKSGKAHLKSYEWVLLSLGVATQNLGVLLVLAAWFAALTWRGQQSGWTGRRYKTLQVGLVCLSLLALGLLLGGIPQGLLSAPDMQIHPASYNGLSWYSDYTTSLLPEAWVISVPLWVYRISMLLWSLWIAFALMRWLKWGWQQLNAGGFWPGDKVD